MKILGLENRHRMNSGNFLCLKSKKFFVLKGTSNIGSVRFSATDVVRHGLVAKIVKAYEEKSKKEYGDE